MIFGLVKGKKESTSLSPMIHGILGCKEYTEWNLDEKEFDCFMKNKEFDGINVTIPYKKECLRYLDSLSPLAKRIGGVNTVIKKGKQLVGYNTDYYGMKFLFEFYKINVKNKSVLILGNGGVSNAIKVLCEDMGAANVYMAYRQGKINFENSDTVCGHVEIIINGTPVGGLFCQDESLINLDNYTKAEAVFDMVYRPFKTPLVLQAEDKGIVADGGLIPLVAQACKSAEWFYEITVDKQKILNIIDEIYKKSRNIVLIGFSCAGKTVIGKMLAQRLNKDFIDVDEEIEKTEKADISTIMAKHGESYFRDVEKKIVRNLYGLTGKIISIGGGTILCKKSADIMRSNGKLVFVKRKLIKKDLCSRPLYKNFDIAKKIYTSRLSLYSKYAEMEIVNNGTLQNTVEKLVKEFI